MCPPSYYGIILLSLPTLISQVDKIIGFHFAFMKLNKIEIEMSIQGLNLKKKNPLAKVSKYWKIPLAKSWFLELIS